MRPLAAADACSDGRHRSQISWLGNSSMRSNALYLRLESRLPIAAMGLCLLAGPRNTHTHTAWCLSTIRDRCTADVDLFWTYCWSSPTSCSSGALTYITKACAATVVSNRATISSRAVIRRSSGAADEELEDAKAGAATGGSSPKSLLSDFSGASET